MTGGTGGFVQDNMSRSYAAGTVRALHCQKPPNAQGKLVRVSRGRIRDVAVDLRRASPSYGRHVAVDLDARNVQLFWVPPGFAHGFATLEPDTEVTFKTTAPYSPEDEIGLAWDDPDLAIDWGVSRAEAVLSDRDRAQPPFATLASPF
ncbi:MAG: dTDP-4-dehydrorhamnose 3,5-epimerase [Deltaproteobacteria bacterium]|nr:MAG: dTDP-4-dehydrorhamnose 3,5-epimerase [Deltaproteobacteria bacterium]